MVVLVGMLCVVIKYDLVVELHHQIKQNTIIDAGFRVCDEDTMMFGDDVDDNG